MSVQIRKCWGPILKLDEIMEVFAPAKQSLESGLDEKRELRD